MSDLDKIKYKKIKNWINEDSEVIRLRAEVESLRSKRQKTQAQFFKAVEADYWLRFKNAKGKVLDLKEAFEPRKNALDEFAQGWYSEYRAAWVSLRQNLSRINARLESVRQQLGNREGQLRSRYLREFRLLIAEEELRRKPTETKTD